MGILRCSSYILGYPRTTYFVELFYGYPSSILLVSKCYLVCIQMLLLFSLYLSAILQYLFLALYRIAKYFFGGIQVLFWGYPHTICYFIMFHSILNPLQ